MSLLKIIEDELNKTEAMRDLLVEIHNELQIAIYSDEGLDGKKGQQLLDDIEKIIKVKKSHRDVNGIPES